MLFFPTTGSIIDEAKTFYNMSGNFSDIGQALYFLISPSPLVFVILGGPLSTPRQLSRLLVAHAIGQPQLGDWRTSPDTDAALRNASHLRTMFENR